MNDLERTLILYESGRLEEAELLCAALAAHLPDNAAAWALRGQIALKRGMFADAENHLSRALELVPGELEVMVNLGIALYGAERPRDALTILKQVLKRAPSNAAAFLYTGLGRLALGQPTEAATALNAALALRPDWPDALEGFAALSLSLGKTEKALSFARRALQAEPGRIPCLELAGYASERLGEYEIAGAYYHQAAKLRPDAATVSKLATALQRMGRHEDAIVAFRHALKRTPESAALQHAYGVSLLALGRLSEGWPLYAKRLAGVSGETSRAGQRPLTAPPQAGMRVVAWADQGIGEQLLFASLVPDLIATGATMALECDYRLAPLLQRSFPGVTVRAHTDPPDPALAAFPDGRFCLSDAATWFRRDFGDFPQHRGYLTAEPDLTAALRAKYRSGHRTPRPLVGIAWRRADGSPLSDAKSVALGRWGPILHVAGCTFVNLQYGDVGAEIAAASKSSGVRILSDPTIDPLMNLDAFAAQVAAMDLVISTSSTTVHMAGALGRPAWTILPMGVGSLWHWFLDRDDSPWYPGMRLFRQSVRRTWRPVIDAVSGALVEFTENWREPT